MRSRVVGLLAACGAISVAAHAGVHGVSLTANQMPAPTSIQNVQPRFDQRGTEVDGTVRSGSTMGLTLGSNPFAEAWNSNAAMGGIRLATGTYSTVDVDLALPAEIPWVIARTYNARQDDSGHHDSNGYQGRNWFQMSQPELVYFDDTSGNDDDIIYLVYGADRYAEYEKEEGGSPDEFVGVNGASGVIEYIPGSPDTYVLHDPSGLVVTFFGDDTSGDDGDWQLWKIEDQAGNVSYVGHATNAATAVSSGYNTDGTIKAAYDSAGRRYSYVYSTLDGVSRLTQVVAEVDDGDVTWETLGDEIEVGKVDYAYYQSGGTTYGDAGNLKLVTTSLPLSGATESYSFAELDIRKTYYRYWVGAFDNSTNPGHAYGLQYVVDPEGTRRFDWTDTTFDEDFLTASESSLKPYAAASFEYDSSHRIDEVWFSGECGCGGGSANGVHLITYADAGGYATEVANTTYSASWGQRTVVQRPDGAYVSQYFDETGQALTRVLSDGDPTGSPSKWVYGVDRDSTGHVSVLYSPASLSSYTHSSGALSYSTSVGLVRYQAYLGDLQTETNWSTGYQASNSNRYRQELRGYAANTETIASQVAANVYLTYRYTYPNLITVSTLAMTDPDELGATSQSGGSVDLVPRAIETDMPVITTGTNGSNSANTAMSYRRADRRTAYTRNTLDRYDYSRYEDGLLVERITDVNLTGSVNGGVDDPNTAFGITEVGGGLNLVTEFAYDPQGRMTLTTLPSSRVTRTYHTKLADGRLVTMSVPSYVDTGTDVFYGPASFSVMNHAGKVEASGVLSFSGGSTTTDISAWLDTAEYEPVRAVADGAVATLSRYSTSIYNESGAQLKESRAYFLIPTIGSSPAWVGSDGTNFDATTYAYDDMGRRIRTVDPTGTINRAVYDVRGNVTAVSIGNDDTGLPGSTLSGTSTMVTTEAREYDGGLDDGNNLLTSVTRYVEGSSTGQRVTSFIHDNRGRVIVTTNPQSPHTVTAYDERGRVTASATYSTTSGLTASAVPTTTSNRLSYSTTLYDRLNRPYDTRSYKVNQSTGVIEQESSADVCIRSLTWYDSEGRVIKTVGGTVQKMEYDRLGRLVRRFTVAEIDDTTYAEADDVSGDAVVEESRTVYQDTTGLVLATGTIQRNHDASNLGALDSNADADALAWTSGNITGRIQITSMWYDSLDRLTTTAQYGTNHASNNVATFDRDGLSAPSRSATVLVTTQAYNDNGTLLSVSDPKDIQTRYFYDAAHRQTHVISNYVNGTPSGVTGADDNFVRYTYSDGLRTEMWVDLDGDGVKDGDDQVTTYDYGVTTGSDPDLSLIDVNNLLYSTSYPDSGGGSDKVFHAYNAQGERIRTEDQIGDALVYTYDTGGRQTSVAATLAGGSPTDASILRIETAYDNRGQVTTVTSYDAASSGTVQNQVKYTYDAWGNVTLIEQDRDSVVGGSGTGEYEVAFTYDEAGATGVTSAFARIHRTKVTYPAGTELSFNFGADVDSIGAETQVHFMMGRVSSASIKPSGGAAVIEAAYDYLGMGHVVRTDYPVPVMWSAVTAGSSAYPGLDRFNRIVESSWTWDYASGTDYNAYEVDLEYDENSNILWAYDRFNGATDYKYTMDGLNRLIDAQRGDESGGSISLENTQQTWTLDQTGNWELFKSDLNGDNDWADANELNDDRTHNLVNELTARDTDDNGSDNYSLTYTAAGQLADDGEHYEYIYDAWGRLVEIENQSSVTVAAFEYNGLGHRIGHQWDKDADNDLDWQWLAYDDKWRVVARYEDGAATNAPFEQVYHHHAGLAGYGGSSYIDAVICRDRDTNTGSSGFETREYVLQNWRADVVALAAPDGDLLERVSYDPYGIPFGTHPADLTKGATGGVAGYGMPDGVVNNDDYSYFLILYGATDRRADWERDGDIDVNDHNAYLAEWTAATGSWGRGVLSNRGNVLGYAGYVHEPATGSAGSGHGTMWHCRLRVHHAGLGRWIQRDPPQFEYEDGSSLYWYGTASALVTRDPTGGPPCGGWNGPTCLGALPLCSLATGTGVGGGSGGGGGGGGGQQPAGEHPWTPFLDPSRWENTPCKRAHFWDPCRRGWVRDDKDCATFCDGHRSVNGQVECDGDEKSRCCVCPRNLNGRSPGSSLPNHVREMLAMCVLTHEEWHWFQHPCDEDHGTAECGAYQAHLECLEQSRGWCSTLSPASRITECERAWDYEIERIRRKVDRHCDGSHDPDDPDNGE